MQMDLPKNSSDVDASRLDGRVAVITGAAGGIAGAIIDRVLQLGARVALLDINDAGLDLLARNFADASRRVIVLRCDVASESEVAAAAERVHIELGGCDLLVNNAGVLPRATSIEAQSVDDWDHCMGVNVRGVFLSTQQFGRQMLARGAGSIVNIASIGAQAPNASPSYGPTKAAVIAFTRQTAVEWGPRGVRANSVSPGFIRTPLSEHMYAHTNLAQVRSNMVPLRRLGKTGEIANVVAFLLSPAAAYVNGQDLQVDGGFLQTTLMHAQAPEVQYGGRHN